jgi:type VI secretion system protein ImpK
MAAEAVSLARAASDFFAYVLLFQQSPDGSRPSPSGFRQQVSGLLDAFAKAPAASKVPPGDLDEARFALVAWTDEVANSSGWSGRAEWEREPLQLQLFGTRRAGVEFFERLKKLRPEQAAALEVYFYCLALGFQGDYAGREGDRMQVVSRTQEKLRRIGRSLELAREKKLLPQAYDVRIELEGRRAGRIWRRLLLLAGALAVLFGALWIALTILAGRVPTPTGS